MALNLKIWRLILPKLKKMKEKLHAKDPFLATTDQSTVMGGSPPALKIS